MEDIPVQGEHNSPTSSSSDNLNLPVKPVSTKLTEPVALVSNYFPVNCNIPDQWVIHKYLIKTSPVLTCHTNQDKRTLKKLVTKHKAILADLFDCYIYNEGAIYSFERVDEATLPTDLESTIKETTYLTSVEFNCEVPFSD